MKHSLARIPFQSGRTARVRMDEAQTAPDRRNQRVIEDSEFASCSYVITRS